MPVCLRIPHVSGKHTLTVTVRYIVIAGRRAKVALQRDPESHTVQIGDPPTLAGVAREVTDRMFVRHDPHNPSGAFPPRQPRSFPTSEGRVVRIEEVDGELPSYRELFTHSKQSLE